MTRLEPLGPIAMEVYAHSTHSQPKQTLDVPNDSFCIAYVFLEHQGTLLDANGSALLPFEATALFEERAQGRTTVAILYLDTVHNLMRCKGSVLGGPGQEHLDLGNL